MLTAIKLALLLQIGPKSFMRCSCRPTRSAKRQARAPLWLHQARAPTFDLSLSWRPP